MNFNHIDSFHNRIYKLHIPGKGWRALHLMQTYSDSERSGGTCKVVFPSNGKFKEETHWSYHVETKVVRLWHDETKMLAQLQPERTPFEWEGFSADNKPARFKMHHGEFLSILVHGLEFRSPGGSVHGAELGVHQGFMSRVLLDRIPDLQLHMVDLWGIHPDDSEFVKSGDLRSKHSWKDYNDNLLLARRRVSKYLWNAHIHITSTHMAADLFEDESLDFVFIDGDHSFKGCYEDCKDWYAKVRPGGIFSGHDYNYHPEGMDIQVTQAVDQFMEEMDLPKANVGPSCVWWMKK